MVSSVFITGITSFIGKRLAEELVKRNLEVSGLARYVSDRTSLPDVSIYFGDMRDLYDLRRILQEIHPDIVIHLAAQTSVEYSFTHESEVFNVNFLGTVNVARLAKECLPDLKKFIFAGSVEAYGNQKFFPISEAQPLNPASPYGVAKAASEVYLKYLYNGYGFPCIILRSANTYGRDKTHNFVIEHIIYEMLSGKKKIPMGDPEPVRDFVYVDDEVDVYIKLIESENQALLGEVFNTGTGIGTSIRDLFEKIRRKLNVECVADWRKISYRPYEIQKLVLDTVKLRMTVGWEPRYSLDLGLDKTIQGWKAWFASG